MNRWVDLIAEGVADLARELGKKSIPVPDTVDWLAEWAQDIRSAQRGLLLLTAHRSKGLEFDHVVILNGGWKALSQAEDSEAPRRLFYVAMTRARRSLAVVAAGMVLAVGATAGLLALGVWLDAALPLAAFALMAAAAWSRRGANQQIKGLALESEGRTMRSLFDRFVSKQVAAELLGNNSTTAPPTTELRNVTVLMSDLRGFSLLSQDHQPDLMVRLLNNYLAVMFEVIEAYGGTIDEVLGDAILVLFGAPHQRHDHAEAALACALAMQLAMERVNQTNASQGLPLLEMGLGLCSGDVVAGTIGSQQRAKYGVVGAAVNLAARIEALTVGGEILAAESTVHAVAAPLRIDAEYRVEVKGASEPLQVFAVGAIGGSHDLVLPIPGPGPQALEQPLAIAYVILKGKQRQGSQFSRQGGSENTITP
jgi:adenylate cyclase